MQVRTADPNAHADTLVRSLQVDRAIRFHTRALLRPYLPRSCRTRWLGEALVGVDSINPAAERQNEGFDDGLRSKRPPRQTRGLSTDGFTLSSTQAYRSATKRRQPATHSEWIRPVATATPMRLQLWMPRTTQAAAASHSAGTGAESDSTTGGLHHPAPLATSAPSDWNEL